MIQFATGKDTCDYIDDIAEAVAYCRRAKRVQNDSARIELLTPEIIDGHVCISIIMPDDVVYNIGYRLTRMSRYLTQKAPSKCTKYKVGNRLFLYKEVDGYLMRYKVN